MKIHLNQTEIPVSTLVKSLGVWIDSNLQFDNHVKKLCNKINGTLSFINKKKKYFTLETRKLMIDSLIFSSIRYCNIIWGKCNKTNRENIQKCINFAAKVVSNGHHGKRDHVTPLLQKLDWPNFDCL